MQTSCFEGDETKVAESFVDFSLLPNKTELKEVTKKQKNKIESAESFVDFALLPNNTESKGGKAFKVICARHNNPRNERKVDI